MSSGSFSNLDEALQLKYDEFFQQLPQVGFQICMDYQDIDNEIPFYQALNDPALLGQNFRRPTDNYPTSTTNGTKTPRNQNREGTLAQRHSTIQEILGESRELTADEIGSVISCEDPIACLQGDA